MWLAATVFTSGMLITEPCLHDEPFLPPHLYGEVDTGTGGPGDTVTFHAAEIESPNLPFGVIALAAVLSGANARSMARRASSCASTTTRVSSTSSPSATHCLHHRA